MTPYKLDVLQLNELNECTILCPDCRTQITMPMNFEESLEGKVKAATPKSCPGCGKGFDESLETVLASLRKASVYSKHTNFKVEFHIKERTEKTLQ